MSNNDFRKFVPTAKKEKKTKIISVEKNRVKNLKLFYACQKKLK